MKEESDELIDIKLKTALQFSRGSNREEGNSWYESVQEGKAALENGSVIDAK